MAAGRSDRAQILNQSLYKGFVWMRMPSREIDPCGTGID